MKHVAMGLSLCVVLPLIASAAYAGDAQKGKYLAQIRCAVCHIVEPNQRQEIADAPPFMVIGSKFGFDPDALVFALVGPHAKMNFGLRRQAARSRAVPCDFDRRDDAIDHAGEHGHRIVRHVSGASKLSDRL